MTQHAGDEPVAQRGEVTPARVVVGGEEASWSNE
jgi:hypothetical protein